MTKFLNRHRGRLAVVVLLLCALAYGSIATGQVGRAVKNGFVACQGTNCDNVLTVGGTLEFTNRGVVTQITSIATGVTVNATSGTITTVSQTIAAGAEGIFTVTNNTVAATDTVVVSIGTVNGGTGNFIAAVSAVGAGSFDVTLTNLAAAAAGNSVLTVNFFVLQSAT